MIKMITLFIITFLTLGLSADQSVAKSDTDELWARLAQGGVSVLIRHALAPGVGDPPEFKLGDCSTQRNLSDTGRQQARRIGMAFRQHGIAIDQVYTSEWCRCRETAELLGLGPVTPLPMLNSFFQAREREKTQTESLSQFLQTTAFAHVIVLVTHQVNINALTGVYISSGEAVVVEACKDGALSVLGTLPFAH